MADGSHFEPTSAALSWLNRLTTDLCLCILDIGLKNWGSCAQLSRFRL